MNWLTLPLRKDSMLKSGANPHQESCLYKYPSETGAVSGLTKHEGSELTYNITNDVSCAWEIISSVYENLKSQYKVKSINSDGYEYTTLFTPLTGTVFTVAIKFGLIVGAALSTNVLDSFKNTYIYDSEEITDVSFACSAVIDEEAAREIVKGNFIAVIAPGYTPEAKEILDTNRKILVISTSRINISNFQGRVINGGLVMQTRDSVLFNWWHVRTKTRPSQQLTDEMAIGTLLSMGAHSYSAILIKQNHIVSIAQACTSGEKAIREVLANAPQIQQDESLADILVTDSPIKLTESVKKLLDSGIYGIIQPGGDYSDNELTAYCNERGIAMVTTDMTHYNY